MSIQLQKRRGSRTQQEHSLIPWSMEPTKRSVVAFALLFALTVYFGLPSSSSSSSSRRQRPRSDGLETSLQPHSLVRTRQEEPTVGHAKELSSSASSECTVWIAPSSIKGHAGYGIYTTRDLTKGDSIMGYNDGISISVEAMPPPHQPWMDLWHSYWWRKNLPDHSSYENPNHVFDLLVGLGSYPNHHCILGSLNYRYADTPYDDAMVDRFQDPGTGAFTYNNGKKPHVYRNVTAGHEIFLDYGYCSRDNDHGVEWADYIVMNQDFRDATRLIDHFAQGRTNEMDYDDEGNLIVYKKAISLYSYDLLPKTKDEFHRFMQGTNQDNLKYRVAERSLEPRTSEWVKANGMCMMNLVPRKSTLPSAGRGAFAQFPIKKGEIITPLPLLQLVERNFSQHEVLVNYCFRHKDSSMMLCPLSNAALINHCSDRTKQCGKKGPNAAYRWASEWDSTTAAWRELSLDDIAAKHERGLSFEIVALRDIAPGEEVFFDYGPEFEEAWAKHVEQWQPPPRVDGFLTAKQANEHEGPILDEFVSGDLRKTVTHDHLFTACQYWSDDVDEHEFYSDTTIGDWTKLKDDEILERYADDGEYYSDGVAYRRHRFWSHWPCTVIRKEERFDDDNGDEDLYTVRIHQSPFHHQLDWDKHDLPRILFGYHREGIHYFVQPLKSDQHLPGVFRHPIGIRDEMIPDAWKDMRSK